MFTCTGGRMLCEACAEPLAKAVPPGGDVVDLAKARGEVALGDSTLLQSMEAYLMCLRPGQEARMTRQELFRLVRLARRGMTR